MRSFRLVQGLPYELLAGPSAGAFTLDSLFRDGKTGVLPLPEVHKAFLYQNTSGIELLTGTATENGSWTESGGVVTAPGSNGADNVEFDLTSSVTAGFYYLVKIPNNMPASAFYVDFGSAGGGLVDGLSSSHSTVIIRPTGTSSVLRVGRGGGSPSGTIGPISVQELPAGAQDATLYEDSGSTPVTEDGGRIALLLESSKWLGTLSDHLAGQPELVTNGEFTTDISGWVDASGPTAEWDAGTLKLTNNLGDIINGAERTITTVAGRFYVEYIDVASTTDGFSFGAGDASNNANLVATDRISSAGQYRAFFQATGTPSYVLPYNFPTTTIGGDITKFDSVSVKEVEGKHYQQTTDANRPTLRIGDGRGFVNRLAWSETFTDAVWTPTNVSVDTLSEGFLVKQDAGSSAYPRVDQALSENFVSGEQYAVSVLCEPDAYDALHITASGSNGRAWFDLTNELSTFSSAINGSTSIEIQPDGRVLCTFSFEAIGNGNIWIGPLVSYQDPANSQTADGVSGVILHSAQLEFGSTASTHQRNDANLGGVGTGANSDTLWVKGNGTNQYLEGTPFAYDAGAALFVFAIKGPAQSNRNFYSEGNSGNSVPYYGFGTGITDTAKMRPAFRNDAGTMLVAFETAQDVFDDNPHVLSIVDTGSRLDIYVDGLLDANSQNYTRSGALTLNVSGLFVLRRATISGYFKGELIPPVIVEGVTDDSTRKKMEIEMARQMGVTLLA